MSAINSFPVFKQTPVILVVDDDKTMRFLLRKVMEDEGYRVIEVSDGQQCLTAYQNVKPDIVLLDAVMPVMDGFTCCEQLLQIARNDFISGLTAFDIGLTMGNTMISKVWGYTPILMLTSLDDEDSINRAFDAGATDYITKPIQPIILRQRLRQLLKQVQFQKQVQAANQTLLQLANMDSLTGLANRRCFDDYLNSQWINLAQEQSPLSLILCDIDFFKSYNDKYGHPLGDTCLQKVAIALKYQAQKAQDLVARYGGEEFSLILPNTDQAGAVHVGNSLQAQVRDLQIIHDGSAINQYVTMSLGVATIIPTWKSSTSDLIIKADKALYQAKSAGRNCIISNISN
ncbi:PleD family two-component system response regulator [Nostoc sp. LEGE 12447]|uniref:response regulator n=1 Tax=unclassified Nostoc TaxID=2593658 RepID=UPI0018817423|nr:MULTISPECIES: PleD family two-component system response regulator [unclassified Nostoc]MBE8990441.1 PleD family two-component system response regulator [Nostoc sp. LEGE 12450]MBE9001597.1 PleD family two-component system response regulator [Nostoc sp. LEGE 12447]